jgi:hypothetical protein
MPRGLFFAAWATVFPESDRGSSHSSGNQTRSPQEKRRKRGWRKQFCSRVTITPQISGTKAQATLPMQGRPDGSPFLAVRPSPSGSPQKSEEFLSSRDAEAGPAPR